MAAVASIGHHDDDDADDNKSVPINDIDVQQLT